VAETFIDALADSATTGGAVEAKRFAAAKPPSHGACLPKSLQAGSWEYLMFSLAIAPTRTRELTTAL
jgi:hypothetical protein